MLTRIDRIQLAVPDREAAAQGWCDLLGAGAAGEDRIDALGALRSSYRIGDGWVELLEPDGDGPVEKAVSDRGAHLFAAGAATRDLPALVERLRERGIRPSVHGDQAFLGVDETGGYGLRVVLSADVPEESVGSVERLYEVTNLVHDAPAVMRQYAELLGLESAAFEPIKSDFYGYEGTLTLFSSDRLDRLEVITPSSPSTTMGRFFARFGESLYMAFAEAADLTGLENRFETAGVGFTSVPKRERRDGGGPGTIFLHPPALGGMMLGLSRPGHAWVWSGHPDRAGGGE